MKLLRLLTWEEEYNYSSDKSVDNFKIEMEDLFNRKTAWHKSINLIGDFTSDTEFTITPRFQSMTIRNFERETAFLKGQIFPEGDKRTRVMFRVRPNSIYPIFFFLFPIIGLFAWRTKLFEGPGNSAMRLGAFAIPIGMLAFGLFAKMAIKNRFIKTFSLRPLQ